MQSISKATSYVELNSRMRPHARFGCGGLGMSVFVHSRYIGNYNAANREFTPITNWEYSFTNDLKTALGYTLGNPTPTEADT